MKEKQNILTAGAVCGVLIFLLPMLGIYISRKYAFTHDENQILALGGVLAVVLLVTALVLAYRHKEQN